MYAVRYLLLITAVLVGAACSDAGGASIVDATSPDNPTADSGGIIGDAATGDASTSDAATGDASTSDAATSDASTSDAATSDGGDDLCAAVDCSDQETPCNTASCNPETGACEVETAADGATCDDGIACTEGDSCRAGMCVAGTNNCACAKNDDCDELQDQNLCNGEFVCGEEDLCVTDPDSLVMCPEATDASCQTRCDPQDGMCKLANAACDDGDACTSEDTCRRGTCAGEPASCGRDIECDESDGCACPEVAPSPVTGQKVVFVDLSFSRNQVTLRNVSGETLMAMDWWLCFGPGRYDSLGDFTLPDGAELTIFFAQSGMNTARQIFLMEATELPEADELGIYNTGGAFGEEENIEAYLRYSRGRGRGSSDDREKVAIDAGDLDRFEDALWTKDDVIGMHQDDDGFVATGASNGAEGFTAIGADCQATRPGA